MFTGAMRMMAEVGPTGATMRALSAQTGMSPGHILYYFGTKDRLFLETVRWSEGELLRIAAERVAHHPDPTDQLRSVVDVYLPDSPEDPRWRLWAYVYARPPTDAEGRSVIETLATGWHELLTAILARASTGASRRPDPEREATRLLMFMEGLAMSMLLGLDAYGRDWYVHEALTWLGIAATGSRRGRRSGVRT